MNEIEKAILAIMVTGELLRVKKKILAIKIVMFMYMANLKDAKAFVERIEAFASNDH